MEIRCPACRKINADNGQCMRCGCDLSRIRTIISDSENFNRQSIQALKKTNYDKARQCAEQAWKLQHNRISAIAEFMVLLGQGDFAGAVKWYARQKKF